MHAGMALGNERFKEGIAKLTGGRVTPRKRGRKPSIKRGQIPFIPS